MDFLYIPVHMKTIWPSLKIVILKKALVAAAIQKCRFQNQGILLLDTGKPGTGPGKNTQSTESTCSSFRGICWDDCVIDAASSGQITPHPSHCITVMGRLGQYESCQRTFAKFRRT